MIACGRLGCLLQWCCRLLLTGVMVLCVSQDPLRRGDGPLALVLAPTRELAQQIEAETQKFSTSSRNKV